MNGMLSAIKQFYLLQYAHKCTQLANFSLFVFCHILNARFTCFSHMHNIFCDCIWVGIFNSNHYMQCIQQLCQSKLCEGEWNIFFFACMHATTCMAGLCIWPCLFDVVNDIKFAYLEYLCWFSISIDTIIKIIWFYCLQCAHKYMKLSIFCSCFLCAYLERTSYMFFSHA